MHMGIYFQAGRLQSDSSQLQSPLAALAKPQTHEDLGLGPVCCDCNFFRFFSGSRAYSQSATRLVEGMTGLLASLC